MRFRHKLSIVLVGLAIVPLVAAGLIVQALLAGDEVRSVDSKLSAGAAGAAAAYRAQLEVAQTLAQQMAGRPDVANAFRQRDASAVDLTAVPPGYAVALADDQGTFAGSVPAGMVWSTTARLNPASHDRRVIVSLPLDTNTLLRVQAQSPVAEGVGLALVVGGRTAASIGGPAGAVSGLRSGESKDARIGTTDVRAQTVDVQGPGRPAQLVANYPSSRISDHIDAVRLKLSRLGGIQTVEELAGLLGREMAVERPPAQADARHQFIDAGGTEAALLGDRTGIREQLLAGFLFVVCRIAHE